MNDCFEIGKVKD